MRGDAKKVFRSTTGQYSMLVDGKLTLIWFILGADGGSRAGVGMRTHDMLAVGNYHVAPLRASSAA